jgi:hypothetical protein
MSLPANQEQSRSRDVALAALTEALEQVGQADGRLARVAKQASGLEQSAARRSSAQQTATAVLRPRSSRGALVFWSLIGPLLVAGIAFAAFAWQSSDGHAARSTIARWVQDGLSTSSVWLKTLERVARQSPTDPEVTGAGPRQPFSAAQSVPQQVAPAVAPPSPELSKSVEAITRELTEVQQAIEQLKTGQAQLAHDNAGLAEHLKETQEQMARQTGELADGLKQARSELIRGGVDAAAQVKASQEQMAGINQQLKATQEQLTRLGPTDQQPPSIDTSRRKSEPTPVPRRVRAGVVPKASGRIQGNRKQESEGVRNEPK